MKKALIIGVTGQDGSYLAELLLNKGYEVYGMVRWSSSFNTGRIQHLHLNTNGHAGGLKLLYGDLNDSSSLSKIIHDILPHEIYNLGAQSHVRLSFDIPEYTADVNGLGAVRLLEAIRLTRSPIKFNQASTSELFGKAKEIPQNEGTPFYPRSPYAASKAFAYYATVNYREAYGLFACNGILFNHESQRRGEQFVTRKITRAVSRIKFGLQDKLFLGNLDTQRDWGHAQDYVEAMWLMMQQEEPDDYVIATGESHTVREFLDEAFGYVDLDWKCFVEIDAKLMRPTEADFLVGDPRKAREKLGWTPRVTFKKLVRMMVDHDLEEIQRSLYHEKVPPKQKNLHVVPKSHYV